ncbi:MAG TPA: hypothetical protein VET47_00120 [Candidatus Limnocylindrales bacterium]|nr:hypothetical protein [Candidatus Limnocylindrales bacterium]
MVNENSGQVIATPPLNKIVPGQELIISVDDSLIPSFGGLKGLDIESSPTANSTGVTSNEWLVAEVDKKVHSSISWGIVDKSPFLFVNIQYPFEQSGVGFNWGNPNNHARPPVMILVVNKATPTPVQMDSVGCPIVDAYTLVSGSWINTGLGEISSKSINPTQCQIAIQSQHLSKFAFSLRHIDSIQNTGGPGQFAVGTVMYDTGSTSLVKSTKNMNLALVVTSLMNFVNPGYTANAELFEGFSSTQCSQVPGYVIMTGNYTGGDMPHRLILLKMSVLDPKGHTLATGGSYILNVGSHKTKMFEAMTRFHGQYSSCTIQIQSAQ